MTEKFPTELKILKYEIQEHAKDFGLDFFDVIFEVVDYNELNIIASQGGFPIRFRNWRFGMEYERMHQGYAYGLQKIYEIVINNDPCYAYLLKSNQVVDQKLVMAHVYGHCDFFKNNYWFSKTDRKAIDHMANHATRIRRYIDKHGFTAVEEFIDSCLSIEALIDPLSLFMGKAEVRDINPEVPRLRSKSYMDRYINPPEFIDEQKKKQDEEVGKKLEREKREIVIEDKERDVLKFLVEHAQLENWQRDILSMIREESYYWTPQGQTKIMNEGWASYWHSKIITQNCLKDSEVIDYAEHHAGTMGVQPGRLNPYKLGMELFLNIEDRWNKGKFGRDYDKCDDQNERKNWDEQLGLGMKKIFSVRKIYNDIGFIDEFLTEDFCREHKLFTYNLNEKTGFYEIGSRDFRTVKQKLLFNLTNQGKPIIYLLDPNFHNAGELLLEHQYSGVPLKLDYAKETLISLEKIWGRPVNISTEDDKGDFMLSCSGSNVTEQRAN